MGRTCNTHDKDENCVAEFQSESFEGKRRRRSVSCWGYNIKADGINLIRDKIQLRVVLSMINV